MVTLVPPSKRLCLRCGRTEVWSADRTTWVTADDSETGGEPHCVHEWDITGNYNPFEESP